MTNTIYEKRILNSIEAREGAEYFNKILSTGILKMDVLPNNYDEFFGEKEEKDYVSYCSFLQSKNGKKVIKMLEDADEQRNS